MTGGAALCGCGAIQLPAWMCTHCESDSESDRSLGYDSCSPQQLKHALL